MLDRKTLRAVSVISGGVDERTIHRFLAGLPVAADNAERIAKALAALGLAPIETPDTTSPPRPAA